MNYITITALTQTGLGCAASNAICLELFNKPDCTTVFFFFKKWHKWRFYHRRNVNFHKRSPLEFQFARFAIKEGSSALKEGSSALKEGSSALKEGSCACLQLMRHKGSIRWIVAFTVHNDTCAKGLLPDTPSLTPMPPRLVAIIAPPR